MKEIQAQCDDQVSKLTSALQTRESELAIVAGEYEQLRIRSEQSVRQSEDMKHEKEATFISKFCYNYLYLFILH